MASGVAIVTNMATSSGSGGSGTPYVVSSSAAYESGYQRLNISFSEPLSVTGANTSIAPSLFTLTLSSGAATGVSVSAVSIDSSTVRLGLSAPLPTGTYRISYTPPTLQSAGRLEDMDGNDAGIFSLDVYNSSASSPASPPQLLSIQGTTFDANTNSIKLRFDQDLNQTGITLSTLLARFSLSVGDLTSNPTQVSNAFNSVGFEGSRTIRLALNNSAVSNYISSQQPFNITYSDPFLNSDDSGNVLEGPSGLDVATFTTSTALSSSSPSGSNNPPTLTGITTIMGASEDTFKEITYADLAAAANEGDLDGDALSFRIDAISSGTLEKWSGSAWVGVTAGSTLLTTGEKLQWKAGANATGTLNAFTVSAYDGALASAVPVPVRVSVMAENDAPVRTSAAPSAISVAEDSNNTTPISLGLSSLVYGTGGGSDETSQSLSYTITGIPAFIDVFKSDGTTQITVNDSLTLGELQGLKFKTLANANGSGSLTWTVRDSGGSSNNGFDLLAQSLTITVGAQNDAPIATGSAALPPVQEDASAISGSSIANLFLANFSDAADTVSSGSSANSLAGIAVTANNSTTAQGKWQWKTSGMSTWTDISLSLSNSSALYLASATSLRFLPAPNFNGTPGGLTTRLVDSSAALNNGSIVNALSNGGSTALSASTVTVSTSVIALNDAPVAFGAVSLAAVLEDATAPNGDTVANLFSGHFSDTADAVGGGSSANGLAGIVVSGNAATAAQGKWQWQAAGASSWTDIASTGLSDATGLFLASTMSLRFLPAAHFNGTPGALSTRLVDSSATGLSNGGSINVSTNGGTTSYSGTTVFLSTSIGAINDAPLRTSAAPTPISVLEDSTNTVASPLGLSSLTYGGGGPDETSQIFTATITGIPAFINILKADGVTQVSVNDTLAVNELQGLKFKTISNANGAGNLTWTIRDSGGTTNNGSDSSSDSLAITVATVNDAPYRSGQSPTLPSGYESTPYLIRAQDLLIGFSDSDITDQLSITNLTATNGTLADNNNGTWSFTPVVSNAINLGQIPEDTSKTLNVDDLLGGSRTAIQVQLYYDVVDSTGAAVSSSSGFELARTSSVSAVTVSNLNVTSGSGSLTANANNTWTFTPTPNWFGPVLFSYGISTGGATLAYTGSLNVQPLNDAPLLNPDSRFLAEDNRTQGFSSLLGNDSDVEASQLSLVMVRDAIDPSNVASVNQAANSPATLLSNGYGTLEVQANGQYSFTANGSLSQALALGQQAQTAFVYQASDGAHWRQRLANRGG
jgi:VCBS repeat-containing protein